MKFGKLLRGTVDARMPQWRDYVLQFKGLKQHIKQAQAALAAQGMSVDDAGATFTALLDQEVEKVNDFYMDRIEEAVIILHALKQHAEQLALAGAPADARTACQRSLVAFHYNLLTLQNYVALNFTAVVKILKKFDKKCGCALRQDYINALVELPFYRCQALGELVEDTEKTFRVVESAAAAASAAAQQVGPPPPKQARPNYSPSPTFAAAAAPTAVSSS
jgi:SPX domain protein involved in polyphosphate accumulation